MNFSTPLIRLLGDPVHLRIFQVLALQRRGQTGRGLGKLVGTSPFKINQALRSLVAQGVVTEEVLGSSHRYSLNAGHALVSEVILPMLRYEQEIFSNLGREIMSRLRPKPLAILLYGSIARREERPDSDLDLLAVYGDAQARKEKLKAQGELMEEIGRRYGNPVSLKKMAVSEFLSRFRKKDSFIRNVIKEGKSIAGLSLTEVLNYGR